MQKLLNELSPTILIRFYHLSLDGQIFHKILISLWQDRNSNPKFYPASQVKF